MKRFLKSSISLFLAITIIFSSAYVGLNEIDFSQINFENPFAVKSRAASSGTCGDNLTWTLDGEGTLTISGVGEMIVGSYDYKNIPWYDMISSIKNVVIDYGVTNIGPVAFFGCYYLESIIIPESVTSIGDMAFYNCVKLESITIPKSVASIGEDAFAWCESLTELNISDNVKTSIGRSAFYCCENLSSISLGDGVTKIGGGAFSNTPYYENVDNWENGVLYINNHLIDASEYKSEFYEIKSGIKTIAGGAFYGCENLEAITMPDSVISIGNAAFQDCTNLESIVVSKNVGYIGDHAFKGCNMLENIDVPDSLVSIGEEAFYDTGYYNNDFNWENGALYLNKHLVDASKITSETYEIKSGTKTIADFVFYDCSSIVSVMIPDTVVNVGIQNFLECPALDSIVVDENNIHYTSADGVLFDENKTKLIRYPSDKSGETYEIPATVTSLESAAFAANLHLESIHIHENIKSIGVEAFVTCQKLKTVTVAEGVRVISSYAFALCPELESVTISNAVSIGICAFYGCDSLKSIELGNALRCIDYAAFSCCTSLYSIIIPDTTIYIAEEAFLGCENLVDVTLSENLKRISQCMFEDCKNLVSIEIPDSVTHIDNVAFGGCVSLKTVKIPRSITSINHAAFGGCVNLKQVSFDNTLVSVDSMAFYGCENLSYVFYNGSEEEWSKVIVREENECLMNAKIHYNSTGHTIVDCVCQICGFQEWNYEKYEDYAVITRYNGFDTEAVIPDTVEGLPVTEIGSMVFFENLSSNSVKIGKNISKISPDAFVFCFVRYLEVDNENAYFSSENGVLFNKNKTEIICYPMGKSGENYEIPDGVESIGVCAFYLCYYPTSITFSDSVTSINEIAFAGCSNLESITISDGLMEIRKSAFADCENLTDVYYYGTENQWKNIIIEDGNEPLINATIHFIHTHTEGEWVVEKDATCTEDGSRYSKCTECGEIANSEIIPARGHTEGDWIIDENATCTGNGSKHKECTVCGDSLENETILASGHDYSTEWTIDIEPTCTEEGSKSRHCSGCDEKTDVIVIEVTGHSYGDWIITQEPSCAETGSKYKVCSICGDKVIETIPAHGHDYATEWTIDIEPTCTEEGSKSRHCSGCDEKTDVIVIEVTGHSYGDWVVTQNPTCTGDGSKHKVCSVCGDNVVEAIDANGHNYSTKWTIDIEPTCTEEGSKSHHCIVCDAKTDVTVIEATDHTATDWVIDKNSTCLEEGSHFKYCTECGVTLETEVIAKKAHIASGWKTDKEATVYKAGSKHKECTECGETIDTATIKQLTCAKPVLKKVYNANSYVKVTWGTVKGADLYRVYRKTGTGEYEYIGSTKNTYYNDKEVGAGKTCRYIVKAKNEAGNSVASASLAIKHIDEPTLKSIENSAYGVLIKWDKVTGAEKYNVYRKVSGGEYKYIGATSDTYYTDKTAESGTKYYYAIRGKRDDSVSSQSASLSKYYLADPTLKTPTSTTSGIKLSWSKVTGAEGYMVYRKTGSGSYSKIATVKGSTKVTYTDSSAQKGKKYYYKVKAYKSSTYSAYSNTKTITDKY